MDQVKVITEAARYLSNCDKAVTSGAEMAVIHQKMQDMATACSVLMDWGTDEVQATLKAYEKANKGHHHLRWRFVVGPLRQAAALTRHASRMHIRAYRAYIKYYAVKDSTGRKFTP